MSEVVSDLLNRVTTDDPFSNLDILRLILFCGIVFSIVFAVLHLLTMLATRWGDRNAALKALACSLLVHVSCSMALILFADLPFTVAALPESGSAEERVKIDRLLLDSEIAVRSHESGNTPVWEKLAPDKTKLARLDYDSPELTPLESVERLPEDVAPADTEVSDVPDRTEAEPQAAIPEDHGQEDPIQTSSPAMKVNEQIAESRPERRPSRLARTQVPIARVGNAPTDVTREAVKGFTDRLAPVISPVRESPDMEASPDPRAVLTSSEPADSVKRRRGPAPSDPNVDDVGVPTENTDEGGPGGRSRPRFSRISPGRSPRRDPTSPVQRQRIARTTVPLSQDYDRVRVNPTRDAFGDSLEVRPAKPRFNARSNRRRVRIPTTYRLRSLENRLDTARRFGGTNESEQAVELSLRWLAAQQEPEGHWSARKYGSGQIDVVRIDGNNVDRRNAGKQADTGITALAILSFLGAGYTREEGRYADSVDRALDWLVRQQAVDGNFAGQSVHHARMYCHALATFAIAEAYALQSDQSVDTRLRAPLLQAVQFIISRQNPYDGGWRYRKGQDGDMSMFGWQLMALKSAELAGMRIPPHVRTGMARFLRKSALGQDGGLAAYRVAADRKHSRVTATMTAEALFCRQMLGYPPGSRANREAVSYMLEHLPAHSSLNLYYWYYGTLAMYQYGGEAWDVWNNNLRDLLVFEQRKTGEFAGSWDPRGPWGPYGGRLYSTTLSTLTLEVYYRFLPLYRMDEFNSPAARDGR